MQRVLVVDDDQGLRETVTEVLAGAGYDVTQAANGAEALSVLRAGLLPCVILLDLMMPVMDGWTFRDEQLREASLAQIPVVVMSASSVRQRASSLDDVEALSKPVRLEQLLSAIDRHCARC